MAYETFYINQESTPNALALNKDHTQAVIAGRNVFKIFQIKETEFVETNNLRVGKNINLNFSCMHVAWSSIEENHIATGATNGAVVVWNLSNINKSKQERVFSDHKRTVNKVSFHYVEPNWLISGSQDGTIRLFDLRCQESTKVFQSNMESVRDVEFNPHSPFAFAAVSENGTIQQWDVRRPDKCTYQFTAHSGPIFACDWHPEQMWLATASRDKTIKVWDLSIKPSLEFSINTIASVSGIKWRPQRKFHLASRSLVLDSSVNVWDVRRPYIPFASFVEHKDVVSGLVWRGDPQVFIATSKDGVVYQHSFKDAICPADNVNPQSISVSCKGDVLFACKANTNVSKPGKGTVKRVLGVPTPSDEFTMAVTTLRCYRPPQPLNLQHWFVEMAIRYLLSGGALGDLCDHNASVAASLSKHSVALVWNVIKTLFTSSSSYFTRDDDINNGGVKAQANTEVAKSVLSDEETKRKKESTTISFGDLFISDTDMDPFNMSTAEKLRLHQMDWTLPVESYNVTVEDTGDRLTPDHEPCSESPDITEGSETANTEEEDRERQPLLNVFWSLKLSSWNPTDLVVDTLFHHAEQGDVQTSVSILIALGEKRSYLTNNTRLDETIQEHWLLSYLDLLSRFQLWNVASEVIQLSWLPSVYELNHQSTTLHTHCGKCKHALIKHGSFCDRCKSCESSKCSICHLPVRGLYSWCQGCSHGGHIKHMQEWFVKNTMCPTGCGHYCESF